MKDFILQCTCLTMVILMFCPKIEGKKILFLTYDPMSSRSHKNFYFGVAEALANRGHNVTMVSSYPSLKIVKNIKEIVLTNYEPEILSSSIFEVGGNENLMANIFFSSPEICVNTLGSTEMEALKNEGFDLIIISVYYNYCHLSLVHHFKVPFIYICPFELANPFSDFIGNVEFPSFVPHKVLDISFPATFLQRLQTTLTYSFTSAVFHFYLKPRMLKICKERNVCSEDMPSLVDIEKNASMIIINSVRALEVPPRPTMPNIIYAGGIHIKPPNRLTKELQDWILESGENGFIYFSTGSCLKSTAMPEKYRKILINVFGSLKQKVIWKWDQNFMEDLPKNVKLGKWFPQQDILGHEQLKLFITHGGLFSTQESTYSGVPVIGMPIFADQFSNIRNAEREGWARYVPWNTLEEKSFREIIIDTLKNESLKSIAKRRSLLMRDTALTPDQEAVFWVEYVLRHRGAAHIRSPLKIMRWYEVYNIDVWIVIILSSIALLYISSLLLIYIIKQIFSKKYIKRN